MGLCLYAIDPDQVGAPAVPVTGNRSYSSFARFRDRLGHVEGRAWWRSRPASDLDPLLHHSDCDGFLTDDECRQVAPRLLTIGAAWLRADANDPDALYALDLGHAMLTAARRGHWLAFM